MALPTVTFLPSKQTIEVKKGTTLFEAAELRGLPVASSCSAENICGKCNMRIITGHENLSPQNEFEVSLLKREKRQLSDRISCMTNVSGDCTVTTSYW